jgi:hypothetical protein
MFSAGISKPDTYINLSHVRQGAKNFLALMLLLQIGLLWGKMISILIIPDITAFPLPKKPYLKRVAKNYP